MNALSFSARRSTLGVACAICVFAGGNLPHPAWAAPADAEALGRVSGVGKAKLARFGAAVLAALKSE